MRNVPEKKERIISLTDVCAQIPSKKLNIKIKHSFVLSKADVYSDLEAKVLQSVPKAFACKLNCCSNTCFSFV